MRFRSILPVMAVLAAGCAHREVATAPPPPPTAPVALAPMPAGARAGMTIPARLPDGGYATPNHRLTAAATIWHVRTALNVAALACRDAAEPVRVARYNALLASERTAFAAAEKTLAAEYKAGGGAAWRDGYDDAMTRLYNYWAQDFARASARRRTRRWHRRRGCPRAGCRRRRRAGWRRWTRRSWISSAPMTRGATSCPRR